jgi:hypothetical protein
VLHDLAAFEHVGVIDDSQRDLRVLLDEQYIDTGIADQVNGLRDRFSVSTDSWTRPLSRR